MNGKGSRPRPLSVTREDFGKRWDETFRRRKKTARKPEAKEAAPARE